MEDGQKIFFYEEAVRVPFLIQWKNHLEEGTKRDFILNTVDIMPTLLSMMGLPIPNEVEGRIKAKVSMVQNPMRMVR